MFKMFAPSEGWRHVEVTDRHTAVDFAHLLRDLSDTHFLLAKKIVLMEDNLSTHKPASLYEALPAAEARRSVRMVCGQSTITNDHCYRPLSGVGATRRRRSGSACTVVVKATTVAYGRRASASERNTTAGRALSPGSHTRTTMPRRSRPGPTAIPTCT